MKAKVDGHRCHFCFDGDVNVIDHTTGAHVALLVQWSLPITSFRLSNFSITTKATEMDASFYVLKTPLSKDHSKERSHFVFILGGY